MSSNGNEPSLAEKLLELSKKLKLNDRQTAFVMELAKDPERNQTHAAIAAGVPPAGARVWACRALKKPNVAEFLSNVDAGIKARAAERAAAETRVAAAPIESAIMDAVEHQVRLTTIARADLGKHLVVDQDGDVRIKVDPAHTGIIREITTKELFGGDKTEGVVLETRIKVADPLPALVALGKVRGWEKQEQPATSTVWLGVLNDLPADKLRETYLKLIANGSNGAG